MSTDDKMKVLRDARQEKRKDSNMLDSEYDKMVKKLITKERDEKNMLLCAQYLIPPKNVKVSICM